MLNDYHSHQKYLILNMVNHLGPISRTELIAFTDYRPASVGSIIKSMIEEGLLVETGYSSSGYGRKRVLLEINHEHICAISISVSAHSITYIAAQINGVVLRRIDQEIDREMPKAQLSEEIAQQARLLFREFADRNIIGIGVCNPLYDPTRYQMNGSLLHGYSKFNDWIQSDLLPKLEQVSTVPVRTFSAVTLPAMAEQRFGVARGARDFICVELSNGIGASIYCNGSPISGANGVAGELGHTVIDYSAECNGICYCGKPGCVESTTAYPALAGEIKAALNRGVFSVLKAHRDPDREITVQDIRRALDEGDQMCIHFVRRAAARLGVAIANLVNILNPELIVLYGFMLELGSVFINQLETSIRENSLVLARSFEIHTSDALERSMPLGAVAEMFSSYLKSEDYRWVYQIRTDDRIADAAEEE